MQIKKKNYVELSPPSEAAIRSATQEFANILGNPKVYCHVHKEPSTDP
jgi:hypothetical protein